MGVAGVTVSGMNYMAVSDVVEAELGGMDGGGMSENY